jgi:MATE family multidrug resistance protein
MALMADSVQEHPFVLRPHRTLVALSLPVLLSLIAEPLTGLADTAFVARLGAAPLAALGVGTVLLSSVYWVFNFLGIGTQTEVARAAGAGHRGRAAEVTGLAMLMAALFGVALMAAGGPLTDDLAGAMGARREVQAGAALYIRIRLLGLPATLLTTVAYGALRGLLDMRTPLRIAVTINALNILLDALLIFGLGPIPALGIAGAAWATVASHWLGAVWGLLAVRARVGLPGCLRGGDARLLLVAGRDLFLRTALLTAFLVLTTRAATRIGSNAGAAHQAIRQVWLFTALVLDAFAATAQSLVSFFLGAGRRDQMLRVARVACLWSLGTGVALAAGMGLGGGVIAALLVPAAARAVFTPAWLATAAFQPLNALSFATDGVHWGTSDYRYLRNAMLAATSLGVAGLALLDESATGALTGVWLVTGGWIAIRAAFGVARIWPGIGASPFRWLPVRGTTTARPPARNAV